MHHDAPAEIFRTSRKKTLGKRGEFTFYTLFDVSRALNLFLVRLLLLKFFCSKRRLHKQKLRSKATGLSFKIDGTHRLR